MSNMSYCRHENTANDMQDVVDNWVEADEVSDLDTYETRGRERIIELAREIVAMADDERE